VAVPIARFLAGLISRRSEANHLSVDFVVYYPSTLLVGGWYESTEVITPRIKGSNFGNAVVAHAFQASCLEAK
jgi:hypothetical protein